LVPREDHAACFSPALAAGASEDADAFEVFSSVFQGNQRLKYGTPEDQINASLYFEARTFLHGLLVMQDRIAMAHGLEERVPFLDNDLVDFSMKLSVRHKLANLEAMKTLDENSYEKLRLRYMDADDGKNVLRLALKDVLPKEALERKKQGFSPPEASWYRGDAIEFVRARLLGAEGQRGLSALINPAYSTRIFEEHVSGKKNHRLLIWSLLCLGYWVDDFFPELADQNAPGPTDR
jgi:asparagine synthase (glutamine-hydrolysing)